MGAYGIRIFICLRGTFGLHMSKTEVCRCTWANLLRIKERCAPVISTRSIVELCGGTHPYNGKAKDCRGEIEMSSSWQHYLLDKAGALPARTTRLHNEPSSCVILLVAFVGCPRTTPADAPFALPRHLSKPAKSRAEQKQIIYFNSQNVQPTRTPWAPRCPSRTQ